MNRKYITNKASFIYVILLIVLGLISIGTVLSYGPICSTITDSYSCGGSEFPCCYWSGGSMTYGNYCYSEYSGYVPSEYTSSYGCDGQTITRPQCDGTTAFVDDVATATPPCAGTCTSYCNYGSAVCGPAPNGEKANCGTCRECSSGSCINSASGTNPFYDCSGSYSCTGSNSQTITRDVCNGAGGCGIPITACTGSCGNYCVAGSSLCKNASSTVVNAVGCSQQGSICQGQNIFQQNICDGSGTCGKVVSSCTGSYDNTCIGGACQSLCGNGVCDILSGETIDSCFNDCSCGNGICDATETVTSCFKDCVPGWTTSDNGWSLLSDGAVHAITSATQNIYLVSDYFDMKADMLYSLSYHSTNQDANCVVTFDLNSNNCTDPTTFKERTGCFNDADPRAEFYDIPSSSNNFSGGYYHDVRLRVKVSNCVRGMDISNISFSESVPSGVVYDYSKVASSLSSLSGCCPQTFCWNGSACIDSSLWMTNASYPAVWNNLFDNSWVDNHVNIDSQARSRGYRCVQDASGVASWVLSDIKYDWNFKSSGYCALPTDCFVGTPVAGSTASKSCIHHDELISDLYTVGSGNHYCYMGNWTTRSYIVAQLLQNLSSGSAYTLHCYDNDTLVFNTPKLTDDKGAEVDAGVLAACVLVKGIHGSDPQIIAGLVLDSDAQTAKTAFLDNLVAQYDKVYSYTGTQGATLGLDCTSSNPTYVVSGTNSLPTNFTTCFEKSYDDAQISLYVYYNQKYGYFLISDSKIDGLSTFTFWEKISKFFSGLFTPYTRFVPVSAINYTTSYDRVYITQGGNGPEVYAVEEYKYDELSRRMKVLLNVRYSGTNYSNNPVNVANMIMPFKKIDADLESNIYDADNSQNIFIKSENRTGLWRYFTSSSRPQLK